MLFKEINKIYYYSDEAGSYAGMQQLLRAAKEKGLMVSVMSVKEYLARQASYSLHMPS